VQQTVNEQQVATWLRHIACSASVT